MEFSWTKEQLDYQKKVIEFAKKELNDSIVSHDDKSDFSRQDWQKCADFGILGLPIPEEYGGRGNDILTSILVMEGLGYGCKDNGLIFGISAQMWDVEMPLLDYGNDEQKNKYLPKLCSGESIGAIAMTEPDSGSDAFSLSTTAQRQGDYYILNGTKTFVTNGPVADLFLIFATINKRMGFMGITTFIVERNTPGFQIGNNIKKMGLKTNPWSELVFDNCKIPVENRLGKEGNGVAIFNDSMEWERSCILASYIGSMERQLEATLKYVKDRKQFKTSIGKFQSVANKIAKMKVNIELAKLMVYKAAFMKDKRKRASMEASIIKVFASECLKSACLDAVQIHGAYGYMTEFEIEKDLRDSIASTIYSGTSEINTMIIAKLLGL